MTERIPRWAIGAGVIVALVGLVAWSFWQRWQVLAASPFPLGVDGYFYPIQLRALLDTGALQYPSSPLTFWFMLPFAAITDPITGAKIGAALGGALIAVPAYGVGARLGRSHGAGIVAAAIATTSASSAYLSIEFVKQGIGLTVALAALWLVLRALDTPSRKRIIAAGVGIFSALLAHKMAAAIVVVIAIPAAIEEARGRGLLRGRRLVYMIAGAIGFAAIALVLGALFPQRLLSTTDLALTGDLFTSEAHWNAPALHTPGLTLVFAHEAVIGAIVACVAAMVLMSRSGAGVTDRRPWRPHIIWWFLFTLPVLAIWLFRWMAAGPPSDVPTAIVATRKHGERTAAWMIVLLGLAIGLPWLAVSDPQGLGFRVRIAAFVPLAMCASIIAAAVGARFSTLVRDAILVGLAFVIVLGTRGERIEGRVLAHPALVTAVMAASDQIPSNTTVIVPERHILFMVAWYTHAKVSLRPDHVPYGERVRMMPLAFIGMGSPLDTTLDAARANPALEPPLGLHSRHRNGLVLVTEPTWDWILAQLPAKARAYWGGWSTI